MKCPTCREAELVMSNRQGIEIAYCLQCRGVWLDRGELDKIIDRSGSGVTALPAAWPTQRNERDHAPHDIRSGYREGYSRRKKKSFPGELFDFD